MAKSMEHLSDFVFITMANVTLARRDAYLAHAKSGIKPETLCYQTGTSSHGHPLPG